jgi:hypothetical protein
MISALKDVFKAAETWPEEDQEALVEAARDIEAQRTGSIMRRLMSLPGLIAASEPGGRAGSLPMKLSRR